MTEPSQSFDKLTIKVLGQQPMKQYFEEESKAASEVMEARELNICSQPDPLSKGDHYFYHIVRI